LIFVVESVMMKCSVDEKGEHLEKLPQGEFPIYFLNCDLAFSLTSNAFWHKH